jgi:hypothetical protein
MKKSQNMQNGLAHQNGFGPAFLQRGSQNIENGLAHQNGFGPAFLQRGSQQAQHNSLISAADCTRWVAISSLPPICSRTNSLKPGVGQQ